MIDLDAYFNRIGYAGTRDASMSTLRAIHALHPAAIPFENIDPLLGRPVRLELQALQDKLVRRRRGGYCFEHNSLLRAVLEALGFAVTPLSARVVWMAPPERPPGPRTHMLLRVEIDGASFITDVGFGGLILDAPVQLIANVEQATPHETMRIVRDGDAYVLQASIATVWQGTYRFTLEEAALADYAIGNWYTSTHPQSLFRNNLLLERLQTDVRLSLLNRKLTRRFRDGRAESRWLETAGDLARVLADDFALDTAGDANALFERLPV